MSSISSTGEWILAKLTAAFGRAVGEAVRDIPARRCVASDQQEAACQHLQESEFMDLTPTVKVGESSSSDRQRRKTDEVAAELLSRVRHAKKPSDSSYSYVRKAKRAPSR